MKYWRAIAFALACLASNASANTVFYLHGKIVEDQGDGARHPAYGEYDYSSIVESLRNMGHTVYSEIREKNTNPKAYADKVVQHIKKLQESGTESKEIVVIGFSKGAQIALLVSQQLDDPAIRFVIQAVCGRWVNRRPDVRVHGEFLSMYDSSDTAGSCKALFARSNLNACEMKLETGLAHGLFYQPRAEWLTPMLRWIEGSLLATNIAPHTVYQCF